MHLIPAMTIKDGKCVRPVTVRAGSTAPVSYEVVEADPGVLAARYVASGARRLHVADLDGAAGRPPNFEAVRRIAAAAGKAEVQVGGGIRAEETVSGYLEAGAQYVVIGSRAVITPHFVQDMCLEFPGHVIVGLDVRNGKLATEGFSKLTQHTLGEVGQLFERDGVAAIVVNDLTRDGALAGANVEAALELARAVTVPVIVAGGVSTLADVEALCAAAGEGVTGAIVGRAFREGKLDLAQAQAHADRLRAA
jgi:phosphoribosylformimino-5-aminoimidazole carboxamide ribotide isomerase